METLKKVVELQKTIPVLPVRNTVLFPNASVPLIVGRAKSVKAIKQAQAHDDLLLVVTQKDGAKEDPRHSDLYTIGTVCLVSKVSQIENDSYQLVANGLFRYKTSQFIDAEGFLQAEGWQLPAVTGEISARVETLTGEIKQLAKAILNIVAIPGSDALVKLIGQIQDPSQVCDLCATFLHLGISAKQEILETEDLEKRLQLLLDHMLREKEKLSLQGEIQSKMMERLTKDQRDHLLREQLRTIHEELGDDSNIHEDLSQKIEEAGLSPEAKKIAKDELSRLAMVQRS